MGITNLKYYDELSCQAQSEALKNITASVNMDKSKAILEAWLIYKANIHRAINNPLHIKRLINGQAAHQKIKQQGDSYLIKFIRENRIIFTDAGEYVYYLTQFVMIRNEQEYIPTPDEQTALRTPYIEVNQRGPGYHDWIYKMHHRVKHFMIR